MFEIIMYVSILSINSDQECECMTERMYKYDCYIKILNLFSDCYGLGADYKGKTNSTRGGIPCQKWSSKAPHNHSYTGPSFHLEATVEEAGSFCRNPRPYHYWPWCFTMEPSRRWGYCNIGAFVICGKCQTGFGDINDKLKNYYNDEDHGVCSSDTIVQTKISDWLSCMEIIEKATMVRPHWVD